MQIGPQYSARHFLDGVHQVVVVVPINADVNEAQDVAQENWPELEKRCQIFTMGNFEFQHHDGNDDRDHPIRKRFDPPLAHACPLEIDDAKFGMELLQGKGGGCRNLNCTSILRWRKGTQDIRLNQISQKRQPLCSGAQL